MKFSTTLFAALMLMLAAGATAKTTNDLSPAELEGRQLAQQLRGACPAQNLTNSANLKIREAQKHTQEIPIRFQITVTDVATSSWEARYETTGTNSEQVTIQHTAGQPSHYRMLTNGQAAEVSPGGVGRSFAGSDFWMCDLGLEFLHWPGQKILPKTTNLKRGREYTLLESTSPNPPTNGYSRVLSWIDKETGGILEAEAYDVKGKLLKDFAPKEFKKVNGQWELQEMEMRNVQTGSRTRLEFDLKK